MKRSQVNAIIREADAFIRQHHFYLPPFAHWTPEDWRGKGAEAREIVDHGLGWDVTDFGRGHFDSFGLALFTIRNGALDNLKRGAARSMPKSCSSCAWTRSRPIISTGRRPRTSSTAAAGRCACSFTTPTQAEKLDESSDFDVSLDGVVHHLSAGAIVRLQPGESITLPTGLYHKFWAEGERVLCGEVSTVNDDHADNRFLEPLPRFSEIEEDEAPLYPLVGDYGQFYQP